VLYNISGLSCIAEHDGFDKKKKNDFDGSVVKGMNLDNFQRSAS